MRGRWAAKSIDLRLCEADLVAICRIRCTATPGAGAGWYRSRCLNRCRRDSTKQERCQSQRLPQVRSNPFRLPRLHPRNWFVDQSRNARTGHRRNGDRRSWREGLHLTTRLIAARTSGPAAHCLTRRGQQLRRERSAERQSRLAACPAIRLKPRMAIAFAAAKPSRRCAATSTSTSCLPRCGGTVRPLHSCKSVEGKGR